MMQIPWPGSIQRHAERRCSLMRGGKGFVLDLIGLELQPGLDCRTQGRGGWWSQKGRGMRCRWRPLGSLATGSSSVKACGRLPPQ